MNQKRMDRIGKRQKKRWLFLFLLIAVLGVCGLVTYFFYQSWTTFAQTYHPLEGRKNVRNITIDKPFTILLMGTDNLSSSESNWRPDTIIVVAMNPKKHSAKMVSIPRDTYAEIANTHGWKDKINSSSTWGRIKGVDPVSNVAVYSTSLSLHRLTTM